MTLIKTSILSAIPTIIRIIGGLISVKIVAIYIGPSGLALLGQIQNFISMISSIATGGIETGVIKYTSEYNDKETKKKIWSTALNISFIFILLISIFIFFFSNLISIRLLQTEQYSSIFKIFSITLIFFALNNLLISILNGQKEIKKLTIVKIADSIFGFAIMIILVVQYKLYGALIATVVSRSLVFFITLVFIVKSEWFKISMFFGKLYEKYLIKLLKYSAMSLIGIAATSLSLIFIRNYIGVQIGWKEAGYWQAVMRISDVYLMLITTTLSVYYLPRLSSIQNEIELRKELLYGYKIIMPISILMALGVYLFKDLIIVLLFTKEFLPMEKLFLYQLIGDVFKIASWLLAYITVAKAMTKIFIITEVAFNILFIVLSMIFVNIFGIIGVTYAFSLSYFLYLITFIFIFRNILFNLGSKPV